MSIMPIAVLGPGEIGHYKREREVSFPAAHRFLTTLRDSHSATQNNVFLHDLTVTDSQEFTWKAWASQRPDVKEAGRTGRTGEQQEEE